MGAERARSLAQAALELYSEHGHEQTTVAEIAKQAGLTERTFFRHYADKREGLFAGSGEQQEPFVRAVADAPSPRRRSKRWPWASTRSPSRSPTAARTRRSDTL